MVGIRCNYDNDWLLKGCVFMGKSFKGLITGLFFAFILIIAFIAGDFFDLNIASTLGLSRKSTQTEHIPDSEPYTADEVVEVEVITPIDNSGSGAIAITQQQVPYVVHVDFRPVLLGEAQLEKKLQIMTQKATAPQIATKDGLFSLSVFKQTKAIIFHGEGSYYVDLSSLTSKDFDIDDVNRSITINIPKPQLSVKLLPEETEFFDSSNGILRFGEMEIPPEQMTTLETQGIARITEILESDTNTWETAIRFAKLSVKEIYEPLIAAQVDEAVKNAADEFAIPAYYTITVSIKE